MIIIMSVKPTLTEELLKVNSALKLILSVIEDQCSGGNKIRNVEDSTSNSNGKQTAKRLLIYRVLRHLKPILDFFKLFIGSRDYYE